MLRYFDFRAYITVCKLDSARYLIGVNNSRAEYFESMEEFLNDKQNKNNDFLLRDSLFLINNNEENNLTDLHIKVNNQNLEKVNFKFWLEYIQPINPQPI